MDSENSYQRLNDTKAKFTQSGLLPNNLPHLDKTRSAFIQDNLYKSDILKCYSLKEVNEEKKVKSAGFKFIWLLNRLTKMQLEMNICYRILETMDLEEDDTPVEELLNIITLRYFSNEFLVIKNEEQTKEIAFRLFHKIFTGNKRENHPKVEKSRNFKIKGKHIEITRSFIIPILEEQEENMDLKSNMVKCQICYQDQPKENFFKMTKCNHEFCLLCIINYMTQKINCNQTLEIKCPTECGQIFNEEEIKKILERSPDLYKKYENFSRMAKLNQDPNVRSCVTPECKGYMRGDKYNNKLVCGICNNAMCFLCRNEWHEGLECEEAMNLEFKKYIERVEVKECPKCKTKIEKNEGCNHMTCTRCNYQFCWICCKRYTRRHYKWYNFLGCPGSQFSQGRNRFYMCEACWILLRIILLAIFVIIGGTLFLAISPLVLIGMAYYYPLCFCKEIIKPKNFLEKCYVYISCFFLVTMFMPLIIILSICPGSCILIKHVLC